MAKVSIIIPIYNVEKYLRNCIESAINQTLKDIEIICVNDGSIDNSLQIIEEYAKKDSRIVLINQKNQGTSIARNKAINSANSDYIIFLDGDDILESTACENALKRILATNADVVCYGTHIIRDDIIYPHWSKNTLENYEDYENIDLNIIKHFIFVSCSKIFKLDFLNKYNIRFPEGLKISEDGIFNLLCLYKGAKYRFLKDVLQIYVKRPDSATNKKNAIEDAIEACRYFINTKEYQNCEDLKLKVIAIEKSISDIIFYYEKLKDTEYRYAQKEIKLFRKYLEKNISKEILKQCNNWNKLKSYSCISTPLKKILQSIFSIKNTKDKTHKQIVLLGFKIKRKIKKEF